MKTLRVTAVVQPGNKIEITAPELQVGEAIDVTLTPSATSGSRRSMLDIIAELPAIHRSPEEWEQIEREFQEERNSWDR